MWIRDSIYTGRSPKDKYIVMDENSKDTVWWTTDEYKNDNHPATQEAWNAVKEIAKKELSNKRLFVVDAFCGANKDTRMAIRFIVEVAWQAHFVTNMFIQPTAEELENFEPDFVVYNASKAKVENYKELGLNSETAVMFNITTKEQVIVNTWYGGEMKKGMFSMMNYFLPLKGMASMHCSANTDMNGENTAIFFGDVYKRQCLQCHSEQLLQFPAELFGSSLDDFSGASCCEAFAFIFLLEGFEFHVFCAFGWSHKLSLIHIYNSCHFIIPTLSSTYFVAVF